MGTTPYTYDASGNLVDDMHVFSWDALDRLTEVEQADEILATYGCDSQNRRIRNTVGDRTVHYHYDVNNLLVAETLADGTILREYIYLDGEPLALKEYLGTPQQLVSSDGEVVWQAVHLPFGKAQQLIEQVENNIRFTGQYFDSKTELHYNGNRYYDPETGRYISTDPIGLAGEMNLYAYVQNDPVNAIGPWGLWVKKNYDKPILMRPEYGVSEWLDPNECYNDDIDGVKPPAWDGNWYKVKGNDKYKMNIIIDKWGFPTPSEDCGGLGGTNFPDYLLQIHFQDEKGQDLKIEPLIGS